MRTTVIAVTMCLSLAVASNASASIAFTIFPDLGSGMGLPSLYSINLNTGASTLIGPTGLGVNRDFEGLAFDPTTGVLYGAIDSAPVSSPVQQSLYTIDTLTGAATFVTDLQTPVLEFGMAFDGSGNLFLNAENPTALGGLYTVDVSDGSMTLINMPAALDALAFGQGKLFGVDTSNQLITIDTALGGAITTVGPLFPPSLFPAGGSVDGQAGLTFAGNDLYLIEETGPNLAGALWKINTVTGAATFVGDTLNSENLAAQGTAVVPEPTTMAIWSLLGVLGGVGYRRRRRKYGM